MKTVKILYIRDSKDPFLRGFLDELNHNYSIFVLDLKNGLFIDYTNNNKIKLSSIPLSKIRLISYFQRYLFAFLFIKKINNIQFDICHILNIKRENFLLIPSLKKQAKRIIITVYGRSTYKNIIKNILFSRYYKHIDAFTFTNSNTAREFYESNRKINKETLHQIMLPLISIKSKTQIDNKIISQFIKKYPINNTKVKISCSSTTSSYDQHYKVIDAINKIKNREKTQLLFLLTYGGSIKYKAKVIKYIEKNLKGFDYIIFDKYLEKAELELYRANTDIFINMRRTDQFAGAILESLSSGSLLISASWLKYELLNKWGVKYHCVNSFQELTSSIDFLVDNFSTIKNQESLSNSMLIHNECGIEAVINKWVHFYNNLL